MDIVWIKLQSICQNSKITEKGQETVRDVEWRAELLPDREWLISHSNYMVW
jgi:hypothetical protein